LEKLKSLLLQFAFDAQCDRLIGEVHVAFRKLYEVLDSCLHVKLFSEQHCDDEMMRLLSCYLWMDKDSKVIWQGADAAYEEVFRSRLFLPQTDVPTTISKWCKGIIEVADQLTQLVRYLARGPVPEFDIASLHFPQQGSIADDYKVTLLSLQLQPHLLALLLKFRALYGKEWHERFPIYATPITPLRKPIDELLHSVHQWTQSSGGPQTLGGYLDTVSACNAQPKTVLSMLEAVERIQVLNWNLGSRRYQSFVDFCRATFGSAMQADAFVGKWAAWCGAGDFIYSVLHGFNEANFKFLLKEYERSQGNDLHFKLPPETESIELEHVFARYIDTDAHFIALGGFESFGIDNRNDFDEKVLWRSGNLTWLWEDCNASLANGTPDLKAAHYRACPGHPSGSGKNVSSGIHISRKLGDELYSLGTHYPSLRRYVEARCAELALFAVERFC